MDFCFSLFLLLISLSAILAQEHEVVHANIVVDGTTAVAEIDKNFICATIDWWPHDKCNYNQCPWGYSSAINLVRALRNFTSMHFSFSFFINLSQNQFVIC